MTFSKQFITLISFIMIVCSCSNSSKELIQAEMLIEDNPDSALAIINHVTENKSLKTENDIAYRDLIKISIYLKQGVNLNPDSILNFAIKHYTSQNQGNRLATCYFLKGRAYKNLQQYEKAMFNFLKAIELLRNDSGLTLSGKLQYEIGEILYYQRDYDNAKKKFKIADLIFVRNGMHAQSFGSKLNFGRCLTAEKSYKLSHDYYLSLYKVKRDSIQTALLMNEIALNFYEWGKLDSSLFYYRKAFNYPSFEKNKAIQYIRMADLFFDLNYVDSAFLYSNESFKYDPDIRTRREAFRILANCNATTKNMVQMTKFMRLYQDYTDSIRKIDAQTKVSYIENLHDTKIEVENTKYNLWYVFTVLCVFLFTAGLFYWIIHRKNQKERILLEQKQIQQKKDLRFEVITRSREAVKNGISQKKTELKSYGKFSTSETRHDFILHIYAELIHFNNKDYFQKEMDSLMNQLYSKLVCRYPGLNEKEIEWACLYMLQIPADDILYLLDYNANSLKKMKQRFAIKVGVELTSKIDTFLKDLIIE